MNTSLKKLLALDKKTNEAFRRPKEKPFTVLPPMGWLALVDPRISDLTMREIAVLGLLRDGLPDKLIADRLGINIQTVRFHLDNASRKLGTKSRVETAVWVERNFWPPGFFQNLATQCFREVSQSTKTSEN